jgi:hypothetical protein
MEDDVTPTLPPSCATKLLSWIVRAEERDALLGDLCEEFLLRASESPQAAAQWYWRQAIRSVPALLTGRARRGRWLSTAAVAVAAYVVVGALNAAGMSIVGRFLAASPSPSRAWAAIVGLLAIAIGAHLASRVRAAAGHLLGGLVMALAVWLSLSPADTSPLWFQLTFFIAGPLAAHLGVVLARRAVVLRL